MRDAFARLLMVVFVAASTPAYAALRALPGLQSIIVPERSAVTVATAYAPDDVRLATRLPALDSASFDMSFIVLAGNLGEYYDVFYSGPDGAPNADGDYLTIEAVWRTAGNASANSGSMNVNEIVLSFDGSPTTSDHADFVASRTYGLDGGGGFSLIAGSESLAVDGDLATFPRFGYTDFGDVTSRMRLTVGFDGYSPPVPEPSGLLLVGIGLGVIAWRRLAFRS